METTHDLQGMDVLFNVSYCARFNFSPKKYINSIIQDINFTARKIYFATRPNLYSIIK